MEETLQLAKRALHLVRLHIPYLAELTHHIELIETRKVDTAGIFASGRLVFNPDWLDELSLEDITFVIAHEVMHLALRSHQRVGNTDRELFNVSHDFIINEMLKKMLNRHNVPAGGLDWEYEYGYYHKLEDQPVEVLMRFIKDALSKGQMGQKIFRKHWKTNEFDQDIIPNTPFADQFEKLLPQNEDFKPSIDLLKITSDILDAEAERQLFPELDNRQIAKKQQIIYQQISKALSTKLIIENVNKIQGIGTAPGEYAHDYQAIKALHQPPWEVALQQWMEFTQRTGRTYARPSRRGQFSNLVRAGYKREGNTLHIVIDTSGSMAGVLGKVLGVIASFCELLFIPQVHIIQCDTEVSEDDWFSPDELLNFQVKGFGGSDMSPGMYRLGEDSQVEYALVITDGFIYYPKYAMPYEVLWVLTESYYDFEPSYGKIISIDK